MKEAEVGVWGGIGGKSHLPVEDVVRRCAKAASMAMRRDKSYAVQAQEYSDIRRGQYTGTTVAPLPHTQAPDECEQAQHGLGSGTYTRGPAQALYTAKAQCLHTRRENGPATKKS